MGINKYEEKFIIINKRHLEELEKINDHKFAVWIFKRSLTLLSPFLPKNKYYICNQDEPYAKKIIQTILRGEDEKVTGRETINLIFTPSEKYKTNTGEVVRCLSVINEPNATKYKRFLLFEYVKTGYLIITNQDGEILSDNYKESAKEILSGNK